MKIRILGGAMLVVGLVTLSIMIYNGTVVDSSIIEGAARQKVYILWGYVSFALSMAGAAIAVAGKDI